MSRVGVWLMINLLLAPLSVIAAKDQLEESDYLTRDKQRIVLLNDQGECVVWNQKTNKKLRIRISAPCTFVKDPDNKNVRQSFTYPKVGEVFIIAGKPIDNLPPDFRSGIPASEQCAVEDRALIIASSGKVRLSKTCFRGEQPTCPNLGKHEQHYWWYAHQDSLRCEAD